MPDDIPAGGTDEGSQQTTEGNATDTVVDFFAALDQEAQPLAVPAAVPATNGETIAPADIAPALSDDVEDAPATLLNEPMQRIIGTRINKLIMEGFKSFAKRTEFVFGEDFNCIVGPNGSGKSNVLDAICFVLGKTSAKSMRAENSASLIYNGGKAKNPAKQAEVTIVFDNSEKTFPTQDAEVKVTRIVHADGASKYKINGKTKTRQEMLELLAAARIDPDGHNIVLQGDIVSFCQLPGVERRQIVEEIAGIGVYEERKQAALRDLEKVEQRLEQATIILKERDGFMKELKKDRDTALKYKELNDNVKASKASFCKLRLNAKEADLGKVTGRMEKHRGKLGEIQARIQKARDDIKGKRDEIQQISAELEQKSDKEQLELQKQVEALRITHNNQMNRQQTVKGELSRIEQRKQSLGSNLEELERRLNDFTTRTDEHKGRIGAIAKELTSLDEQLSQFKKKHHIADDTSKTEEEIHTLDTKAEEKQKELQTLGEQRQNAMREQDVLAFKLQTIDQEIAKVKELGKEHEGELAALKQKKEEFKKAVLELNQLLNDDSRMAAELAQGRSQALKLAEELAKLEVKQAAAEESVAGNVAVKSIIDNRKRFAGVFGTVAELGQVNQKYSLALEVAASHRIHSIVCEDDGVAAKCIGYLKDQKLGIATFLPLNKMAKAGVGDDVRKLSDQKGVLGLALDLVKYDPKFRNAFSYVFGSTLVVDTLATARRIGIGKVRMVTLDGDLCEGSGAITGGHRGKKVGAFRDDAVGDQIGKVNGEIDALQGKLAGTDKHKKENEERINRLRELKATLEGDIIKTERSLKIETTDLDANASYKKELQQRSRQLEKEIDKLMQQQREKTVELATLKGERDKLIEALTSMRNPRLQAELNTFSERRRTLETEKVVLETEIKNIGEQRQDLVGKEHQGTKDVLGDLDKEKTGLEKESKDLTRNLKQLEKDIEAKQKEQEKFQSRFKELFARSKELNDKVLTLEKKALEHEDEGHKEDIEINALSISEASLKTERSVFVAEFEQYAGIELRLDKSEEQLKKEIADFEKMAADVGSVNMRALDIYDTAAREFATLVEKKDTLAREKDSVVNLMNEIEGKKTTMFMDTLKSMQTDFAKIFSQLTSKGQVELELEKPEQPFEGGLDIKVRLTGNKFLDLRSLSGGEKTLVALAFIFAVQEHSPASFYVLDEVDAALDKRNADKLAKLIRSYSERAQYVVISHNDSVVSEANILYGVSMGDHSASQVVSLKI
jgi:chromosome segregation protein